MPSITDVWVAGAVSFFGASAKTKSVADLVALATNDISGQTAGSTSDKVVKYNIPTIPGAGPTRMTVNYGLSRGRGRGRNG